VASKNFFFGSEPYVVCLAKSHKKKGTHARFFFIMAFFGVFIKGFQNKKNKIENWKNHA
jgi:hypothetical protein